MGWIVLLSAIVLLIARWVLGPVFEQQELFDLEGQVELDHLLADKARILRGIKDLEREHESGFMDGDAYAESRRDYLERAVALNREIARSTGVDPASLAEPAGGMREGGSGR